MREFLKFEKQPLYVQLMESIKAKIEEGELKAGDKLPSEALLQKSYHVSRVTVRKALSELVRENYLISVRGKGSYVSQVPVFKKKTEIRSFTELCRQQGKATIARVINVNVIQGTQEQCAFFELKDNPFVLDIERVRKVDGNPVVYERSIFPSSYAFLKEEDLRGSVYELLRNKFWIYPAIRGLNEASIQNAGEREMEYLGIKKGVPVLKSRVQIYDIAGKPLHEVWQIIRIDRPELFRYYSE